MVVGIAAVAAAAAAAAFLLASSWWWFWCPLFVLEGLLVLFFVTFKLPVVL